jgi:vancomycin resistance protein YoaR
MKHRIPVALLSGALLRGALLRSALGAGLLALVFGVLVGRALEQWWLGERVMPHVVVWGVDYGGWDPSRVRESLTARKATLQQRRCKVVIQQHGFVVTPGDLGFDFDVERAARTISEAGRTGSWWQRWSWRLARLFTASQVPLPVVFDPQKLQAKLDEWQREGIADPPVPAAIVIEQGKAKGVPPRAGTRIDAAAVQSTWLRALSTDTAAGELSVPLPVRREEPKLDEGVLSQAVERAQHLLAGPVVLTHEWGELTLSPSVLGAMLRTEMRGAHELHIDLDDAALDSQLTSLRVALERPSANARFVVETGDKLRIEPSATARRVTTAQVEQSIWNAAQTTGRSAVLPVTEVDEATLTTAQAEALRISKKVSSFVTYFPCCQPRVKNIARMAELLDGTVLHPGEILSVNGRVGPRTPARGFVAGPTIVEGEMEDTFGGGVSQFATTLFNAVLNGGYQIIERQAHSYYFQRYPMGHEATLSFPKPDLIFRNDTEFGLLIQARVAKTSVRITLYGDNEGRKVERKLSHAFDFTDPKIDYVPNDKLAPDEHEELERGSRGFSVVVTRVLTLANGQRSEEARKVVYKPREAVVAIHPCNIPKEDDDYTGEECPKIEPEEGAESAEPGEPTLSAPRASQKGD